VTDTVSSTKPYLIRAIHEWCADNGLTPYLAVTVDERTEVPREFVRAGEIVLNVSMGATDRLQIGNERISFQARFGGVARSLSIPIEQVSAIYARENGQGMAFEVPKPLAVSPEPQADAVAAAPASTEERSGRASDSPFIAEAPTPPEGPATPPPSGGGRPKLTRVK
jgi:stringent starvation protein B